MEFLMMNDSKPINPARLPPGTREVAQGVGFALCSRPARITGADRGLSIQVEPGSIAPAPRNQRI